jgi:hypothetical protein
MTKEKIGPVRAKLTGLCFNARAARVVPRLLIVIVAGFMRPQVAFDLTPSRRGAR